MMDTYTQPVTTKRQYRSLEEKQRIVGEALADGASVARVARAHGVNANLVFNWCRLYRAGRLRRRSEAKLLPVRVTGESCTPPAGNTQIWIAAGVTDLRRGFSGLSALAKQT